MVRRRWRASAKPMPRDAGETRDQGGILGVLWACSRDWRDWETLCPLGYLIDGSEGVLGGGSGIGDDIATLGEDRLGRFGLVGLRAR